MGGRIGRSYLERPVNIRVYIMGSRCCLNIPLRRVGIQCFVSWRALLMLTAVMRVVPTTGHIKPVPVVGSDVSSPATIKLEETDIKICFRIVFYVLCAGFYILRSFPALR